MHILWDILGLRRSRRHFADDIFRSIFLNENVLILIIISLKFVPRGPINNIPALVKIMVRHRSGDKPLSKPMMISSMTHKCVTRLQWVKDKILLVYIHYTENPDFQLYGIHSQTINTTWSIYFEKFQWKQITHTDHCPRHILNHIEILSAMMLQSKSGLASHREHIGNSVKHEMSITELCPDQCKEMNYWQGSVKEETSIGERLSP